VVCIAGLGGTADEWNPVRLGLGRHGMVVAAGVASGPTPAGRGGPLDAAVDAVDRVLAGAPPGSAVIGHSMGGLAGMLVAARAGDRLAGLVLASAFVPAARNGRSLVVTLADYASHRALFAADAAGRRRPQADGIPKLDRRTRVAGLAALGRYGLRPTAFHALADRIACPVLVVHGDRDHHVPVTFALAAAARHPAWEVRLLPGAGHFAHRDQPTAWLAAVEPWLAGLLDR